MKNTKELFSRIRNMQSPDDLLQPDYDAARSSAYLRNLMDTHHISARDMIIHLNIEKSYLYQILNGRRAPSREFLIRFSFFLRLDLTQTQRLFNMAGRQPLYPRCREDAAVIYAITHKLDYNQYEDLINAMEQPHEK